MLADAGVKTNVAAYRKELVTRLSPPEGKLLTRIMQMAWEPSGELRVITEHGIRWMDHALIADRTGASFLLSVGGHVWRYGPAPAKPPANPASTIACR